jgi:hypothetical protein
MTKRCVGDVEALVAEGADALGGSVIWDWQWGQIHA